jgi:Ca-activated chloride channel family protein
MSFEYPFFFILIPIYIFCKIKCPAKVESIIFPFTKPFETKKSMSFLDILIVILISTALSTPIETKIIKNKSNYGYDIVTILDTSGSMNENNKLDNAKKIVAEFAEKRTNDRLGLVIFGNIAYIASPLTFDKKNFKEILQRIFISIAGGRTALYDALFLSENLFKNSKAKEKIAILITDGQDNASITPLDVVLKSLKKKNIKVYTIGLGLNINKDVLNKISISTGGKFYHVTNINQLKQIFNDINQLEKSKLKKNEYLISHYFQYPLFIAAILFIIFLIKYRRKIWNF